MKIVNARSYPVEVAGKIVDPGSTVDVPADDAKRLLEQTDAWHQPAKKKGNR